MIEPGARIGILGGGQLERMTVLAGRRMGFRFDVLSEARGSAAGMVADREVVASFEDEGAVRAFAREVGVVTVQFENIPARALQAAAEETVVYPGAEVLHICQNREREKAFLDAHGFACARNRVVGSRESLQAAVEELGFPCVLKTADFGYDGKGQVKLEGVAGLEAAWQSLGGHRGVVEEWVDFEGEYSVICARSAEGEIRCFPVAKNVHRNHILHLSTSPSGLDGRCENAAVELGCGIAEALGVVGLLAVELFLGRDGRWLVNELAPRPHNSGHFTYDACVTSQFEQHLRAICGLPLGDTSRLSPVAMVNLLGDVFPSDGRRRSWREVLTNDRARLHLYDKGEARQGRKMGHYCVLADSVEKAEGEALTIFGQL